ncbi:hypothetical protein Ciccas_005542 [Cichlidogyrus casuarinus]|uniref:Uncharacterized protein n=1 Tax=Cichlidogyrus casuarinus TaxID=1844966 RepID=A0ABD2Q9B0_9PLAT
MDEFEWNLKHYSRSFDSNGFLSVKYSGLSDYGKVDLEVIFSEQSQFEQNPPKLKFIPGLNLVANVVYDSIQGSLKGQMIYDYIVYSNFKLEDGESFPLEKVTFMSDELTPGIFTEFNLFLGEKTGNVKPTPSGSSPFYSQHRPVCYNSVTNPSLSTSEILDFQSQNLVDWKSYFIHQNKTIAAYFYAENITQNSRSLSFSCGEAASNNNITSMSFLFGFDQPPVTRIGYKSKVILIILLIIPTACFVGCIVFIISKKLNDPNKTHADMESEANDPLV